MMKNYIKKLGRGSAFSTKDFLHLGFTRPQIYYRLKKLVDSGMIFRLGYGIYTYPYDSKILNKKVMAGMDVIAKALARKNSWLLSPTTHAALNGLGLSTQVPMRVVYLSTGPSYQYFFNFKNGDLILLNMPKEEGNLEEKSQYVVQAIKGLGEGRVREEDLAIIRKAFTRKELRRIKRDSRLVEKWVVNEIAKL